MYAIGFTSHPSSRTISPPRLADAIATALSREALSGAFVEETFCEVLGKKSPFVRRCAARLVAALGDGRRVRAILIRRHLLRDKAFRRACARLEDQRFTVPSSAFGSPTMAPARGFPANVALPSLVDVGTLARWLEVPLEELLWLADQRTLESRPRDRRLRNYAYRWIEKRGGDARLLEAPKAKLKALQRRVAREIVGRIPPHEAVHGFRPGRDIIGFAAPHVGRAAVLRLDLRDFFPTIGSSTILSIFLTAGYPERVARVLAALCVNTAPPEVTLAAPLAKSRVDRRFALRKLYGSPHLPQGAPTSPALANLALFGADRRLAALATAFGAVYTRYADDLVFSGDEGLARRAARFLALAREIVQDEGFVVNAAKTRCFRASVAQRVAGLVVNARVNVPRREREKLEAILFNAVRHGPASQNRAGVPDFQAHLRGRVAHLTHVNRAHGEALRALFDRIDWTVEAGCSETRVGD